MKIDDLLKQTNEWLKETGPECEIVMSSRVRYARNLKGIPFSHWAGTKQRKKVLSIIEPVLLRSSYLKNSLFLKMDKVSSIDKQFLVERHLISRELASGNGSKAVNISEKEIFSLMINEEDHLRSQVMQSGFNLNEAFRLIEKLDLELEKSFDFAYDQRWGYLTACPTNVGTGMRASVMLHLPALVMTKRVRRILESITKLNLAVRGLYGEGSEAAGNFFQISNQVTLGRSERELIDGITRIIRQIINYEQKARDFLFEDSKKQLEDKIFRAYAILSNARIISSKETIDLLSLARLGINLNILPNINIKTINELFILIQPAHLQKIEGRLLDIEERDFKRAQLVRKKLKT
ncbi:MAG: protein arginine kinase [Candidatus Omnitrophica bacterium]|nr:protein arginine kinase [Candidatus Omnitrophota bacterium]